MLLNLFIWLGLNDLRFLFCSNVCISIQIDTQLFKLYHINCLSYLKLIVSLILFFFAVKITVSSFNYQHERLKTPKFEKPTFGGPQFDIGLIVQHNGKESKGEPPNPPKKGGGGGGPMNGLGFAGTNEGNG